MPYCQNCGTQLPEDARFCPNCGAPVRLKPQVTPEAKETALRYIVVGLLGAFLSVLISSLFNVNVNLYFIPQFIASIIIIFAYRINDFKDSLITAFTIYLFTDGIIGGLVLGYSYVFHVPYEIIWMPKIWEVILYAFTPISAILAAYIGVKISPKKKEPILLPPKRREGPGGVII